jgi:hypothetical protein
VSVADATEYPTKRMLFPSALAIAAIMFVGFARNYYLRHWLGTRVLSWPAQAHGLVMTSWVLLFLFQALLVSKHRIDLHRKLGMIGAALSAIVVAFGSYTIVADIARQFPGAELGLRLEAFVAFDGISLLVFACLIAAALAWRRRPEIHRRLMLIAMISLPPPALGRLVAYLTHQHIEAIVLGLMTALALAPSLVDARRSGRLHIALVSGGATVVAANAATFLAQIAIP